MWSGGVVKSIDRVRRWFAHLEQPVEAFKRLEKQTFEAVLEDYLKLLLTVAFATAVFSLFISVLKAAYFSLALVVDVQWWRMFNYAMGRATSLFFLYLFLGTFGLFLVSIPIAPFLRAKYTRVLSVLFLALTPLLLFGWLYMFAPALGIWSVILLFIGARIQRRARKVKRTSIQQRD